MNRPDTLAEVARRLKIDPGAQHVLIAGFLDNFYTQPHSRQAMIDPEPELTGDAVLDATLAAMGEHLARRWALKIPTWTDQPERFLKRPYFPKHAQALKPMLIAQSPLAFRRRLIFTEHEPLRRARMPVAAHSAKVS
jgi:hypothetical protein